MERQKNCLIERERKKEKERERMRSRNIERNGKTHVQIEKEKQT